MYNIEDNYWWYVGLRELVYSFIDKLSRSKDDLKILDAGCGTGKTLEKFKSYNSYGLDYSEEALNFCKLRKLNNLVRGSVCDLPYKSNLLDAIISLDVLYHAEVDDEKTLKEIYRVMNSKGILLLNLPAYNFLRGKHDEAVHTRQRYTVRDLKAKLEKAGFKIERITYRNTILFPVAVIKRIMERFSPVTNDKAESDLKPLPALINKLLTGLLLLENTLIAKGVYFPFGLSVYCVARK